MSTVLDAPTAPAPAAELKLAFAPSSVWPAWFQAEQRTAWEDFLATPAPTRRDEPWRFANLRALDLAAFAVAPAAASEGKLINASAGLDRTAARFVFGNNALVHQEIGALPEGVIVKPLVAAAHEHPDLFRQYFMAQPVELGSHRYAQLHRALLTGGVFVHVPKNVEVALPVEIFHWVEGENSAVFPHTLVVLGDHAKITVIDHFRSADGARALACGVNDLHLGDGAQLTYVGVQDWSRETLAFHLNSTVVGRAANSTALLTNLGGRTVRGESFSRLVGDGGRSVMLSFNVADGSREIDQRTFQDHAAKHATSDLLYHNVVDDTARTIFAGIIRVEEGEARTDAYQKVHNLMLSRTAQAVSMPGLEILNDDVRCSHGATSSGIDEEELFYMEARGIPRRLAGKLIVAGRFNSLVERIEDETLRENLSALVARRLGVS